MADGGVLVGLRHTLHERTPPGVRFVFGFAWACPGTFEAETPANAPGAREPER